MIVKYIQHLSLPVPRWVKAMGFGREVVSMQARHERCREAWAPHLEAARALITEAAESCVKTDHAVILGSGLLLDIPLGELAARFERIDLIDLVHTRHVRRQAKAFGNVNIIEADISGAARSVYSLSVTAEPDGDRPAPPIGMKATSHAYIAATVEDTLANPSALIDLPVPAPDPALLDGANLVVSANLVSQLPLLLMGWIEAQCPWAEDDAKDAFARSVVDHHLALLQNFATDNPESRVALIAEVLRLVHDAGTPVRKIDALFGAQILNEGHEWWWDIAPRPEIDNDVDVKLRILGIPDLARAPQSRICRNTTLAAP